MFKRELDGLKFTFHLAGINNQNFLMRDEETGTYWQQINGAAVSGPLAGHRLELVHADELTLGLWKAEQPDGTIIKDVAQYTSEYSKKDWDVRMQKAPTVLSYAERGMTPRTLVLGIRAFGASRAFLHDAVIAQKLVKDHVGSEPVLLVVGPDGKSIRAFRARVPGMEEEPDFYRMQDAPSFMMDGATGSRWNFQGCAIDGKLKGSCLERLDMIQDYWFDWRHYNPTTTIAGKPPHS